MLEMLKSKLKAARAAVVDAEHAVENTIERSPERLARQRLDERQADLQQVELDIKLAELAQLDETISALLQEKTSLQTRIRAKLVDLIPDLQRLDNVEDEGSRLSREAFSLAHETRQPLKSSWRDPRLPGVSPRIKAWLTALEG